MSAPLVASANARPICSSTTLPIHQRWLEQAVQLARANHRQGGRPFAALLVRDGQLVASAVNGIHLDGDPTRHAELEALRKASQSGRLAGSIVYASGHPCPMCLGALVMNGIAAVYYAFDNADAAPLGFDSTAAYQAGAAAGTASSAAGQTGRNHDGGGSLRPPAATSCT